MNVHQSGFNALPCSLVWRTSVTRPNSASLLSLSLDDSMFRKTDFPARSDHCSNVRRTESISVSVSVALDIVGGYTSQTPAVCAEPHRNFQDKKESCTSLRPTGQAKELNTTSLCSLEPVNFHGNIGQSIPETSTRPS